MNLLKNQNPNFLDDKYDEYFSEERRSSSRFEISKSRRDFDGKKEASTHHPWKRELDGFSREVVA